MFETFVIYNKKPKNARFEPLFILPVDMYIRKAIWGNSEGLLRCAGRPSDVRFVTQDAPMVRENLLWIDFRATDVNVRQVTTSTSNHDIERRFSTMIIWNFHKIFGVQILNDCVLHTV